MCILKSERGESRCLLKTSLSTCGCSFGTPRLLKSSLRSLLALTFSWAKSTTSFDSPSPSLPKTITKGLLGGSREDRSTQPSCREVARTSWVDLMSVIHLEKSGTLSTLLLNTSPMDTRMHFLYQGEQLRRAKEAAGLALATLHEEVSAPEVHGISPVTAQDDVKAEVCSGPDYPAEVSGVGYLLQRYYALGWGIRGGEARPRRNVSVRYHPSSYGESAQGSQLRGREEDHPEVGVLSCVLDNTEGGGLLGFVIK